MHLLRIAAAVLFGVMVLTLVPPIRAADERLQRVIDNVRTYEALYQNIEAYITRSYKLRDPDELKLFDPPVPGSPPDGSPIMVKSFTETARTVLQGRFLYFRKDKKSLLSNNTTKSYTLEMGYDGEYTRKAQTRVANLVRGLDGHEQLFRPHTWLLQGASVVCPLSVWLTGGEELRTYPGAGLYRSSWAVETFYEGEEMVDGLHTVKLRAKGTSRSTGKLITRRFLWLAVDRNYIPIKTVAYNSATSLTLPKEVGRLTDLREIAPGVWMPFRRSAEVYSDAKLRDNRAVIANVRETSLTKVDLSPHYEISLFRDIPIPDGTIVYEVKDGGIIGEYVQGEDTRSRWQATRRPWWWWLAAPLAGLAVVSGWAVYRRRRRRGTSAPSA